MKNKLGLFVVGLLFFTCNAVAQLPSNVVINITTIPPYSPYLSDYLVYENKTLINVTAIGTPGETYNLYFTGSITGDNGISIKTKSDQYPSQPFTIKANVPTNLTGNDLKEIFDLSMVDVVGTTLKTVVRSNGVPEGNYTICIQAHDYQTKEPIGFENCGAPMSIVHVNPPTLTSPQCESDVSVTTPQTLLLSWTYNPGVTHTTRYLIKMVELLDTQNPYDAINSQTTPAFFEKTVSGINYMYTAVDPKLTPGKRYAWRVKAFDLNDKTKFKNNGESEVCWFTYQNPVRETETTTITREVPTNTGSQISGVANYYFVEHSTVLGKNRKGSNVQLLPLKNTPVQLIEVWSMAELFKVKRAVGKDKKGNLIYQMVDSIGAQNFSDILLGSASPSAQYPKTSNCGNTVAHATTDEAGHFHFDIPSSFKSQILDTFSLSAAQSTDGRAHRMAYVTGLWMKYDSPYYYSSGQVIYIQNSVKIDDLASYQQAKNYSLKVNLKNFNQSKDYYTNQLVPEEGKTSKELDVYVLKLKKSGVSLPYNECNANSSPTTITINKKQYWVYAQKTAQQNSSVTFNDLIQNIYPSGINSDEYYIYAKPKDAKNVAYQPTKFTWNACPFNDCFQTYQFDQYMGKYVKQEMDLSPYQISLAISGKLKKVFAQDNGAPDIFNAKPLANVAIKLVGQWVIKNEADQLIYPINGNSNDFAAGTTNADGEFSLNTGNTTFYQLGANGMNSYKNSSGTYYTKDGTAKTVTGKEYYVLRIVVQSPYYYSPDLDLLVEPGYNYELGDLYANVREANVEIDGVRSINTDLDVNKPGGFMNPAKKSGERVYLCVNPKKLPIDFPMNENKLFSLTRKEIVSNGVTYKVIDETVSGLEGICIFKNVVLNNSSNSNDRYYYFTESPDQSFDNFSSEFVNIMYAIQDKENEQKPFFNSQQYIKMYNQQKSLHQIKLSNKLYTWAQLPTILGAVYPESNYSTNPLSGVTVEVYDIPESTIGESTFGKNGFAGVLFKGQLKKLGIMPEASMQTGLNGKFEFNVNTSVPGKTNRKLVYFTKNGFTPTGFFVNAGAKITKGQKASLSKIFLELPAIVLGKVVDAETGEFIHAKVVVGEDFSWSETDEVYPLVKQGNYYIPSTKASAQTLKMNAPRTNGVAFHIYPGDNDTYEPLVEYHDIKLFGDQPNFTFKVKRRQHHILIRAHAPGDDYVKNNIMIKATIMNTNPEISSQVTSVNEKDNNNQTVKVYQAKLDFPSSATNFLVKLESLANGVCYESKIVSIEDAAQYLHTFNFELKPCKKVICHIDDDKGKPAPNVRIYIEELPYTVPEVFTDINGDAEIMGVPVDGKYTIVAIPPTTMKNYIGNQKLVNMANYNGTKIKLKLSYFNSMDISSLLGFPMEVKNVTFGVGPNLGKTFISGRLLIKNGNSVFKIQPISSSLSSYTLNNNFDFEFVEIVASSQKASSGLPLAVPTSDFWSTTTSKSMTVFNDYDAYSFSAFGAFVKKVSDNSGKIQSPVFLESASFKKGFTISDVANSLYISNSSYTGKTLGVDVAEFLDVFSSDGSTPSSLGTTFKVSSWNYKNPYFVLHNRYIGEATINGSTFNKEGLHLTTILHTNINQLANPDIKLNVGIVNISKTQTEGIFSTNPLEIPMDKWKFAINDWTLNSSGLTVSGKILAGALTVPAKKVLIDFDRFNYGTYEIDGIKLGGNIPLNIDKNNTSVSFGFDNGFGSTGSWSLSLLPLKGDLLTSISNLPGLNPTDVINLKNVSLYSRGSDDENVIMLSESTPWVTLNGVSKFRPSFAFASTGAINFRGKLDLQIPKMSELADAFTLRYESKSGVLKLSPPEESFKNLNINTKGVRITFDVKNQLFTTDKLVLHGKISDENPAIKYVYDITLTKTSKGTSIVVDGTNQKFPYSDGASGLEKVSGSMTTASNNSEWNNFTFEGDLYGLTGISDANKHMKFRVEGDLVANDQRVGVNNVAMDGLGSGSITYDFNQKALIGNLHIDQDLSNCHLAGDVDLKFGGGDWYVFGSTIATNIQNAPVNSAKCGFFVGKGVISGNIQTVLSQYFYQQLLPDPFPKGSYTGALFCTEAALPVPIIPQFNIDLNPIVHCTLEHAIHLNNYTGISLDYPKISYDLGGQIYAYIHAGAGASIGLACAGADFSASAGAGLYGHIDLNVPGIDLNPVQMMSNVKNAILNANITMQGEVFLNL